MSPTEKPHKSFWEIAAQISVADFGARWGVIFAPIGFAKQYADTLLHELEFLLDPPLYAEKVTITNPQELIKTSQKKQSILIIDGLENFRPEDWYEIDAQRSLLSRITSAILVLEETQEANIVSHAPNLWNWIAGRVWWPIENNHLSEEQTNKYLESLREKYDLTDQEVIQLAKEGRLPTDPDFAIWLVLLGFGELIGRESTV